MKLEIVESYIKNKRTRTHRPTKDVMLSLSSSKYKIVHIHLYNEKQGNFSSSAYWTISYIPTAKKLYIMYGNMGEGNKVRRGKSEIGSISYTHEDLYDFLEESGSRTYHYNLDFDSECKRYYIQL